MRHTSKLLIFLGLTFYISGSYASGWHTATINRIQTGEDKSVSLYVNGPNHECGSDRLIMNDTNAPGASWIYSSLLAYQAQGRKVQFLIVSCSGTSAIFNRIEDLD